METIVLYPSPGMGHLISMVELGKFILKHHPSFTITILITATPSFSTATTYIRHISTTICPSITFHHLPPAPLNPTTYPTPEALIFETLRLNIPHVQRALQAMITTNNDKVSAFIIDLFCTSSLSISKQLGIPTYYFFTSGVSFLAFLLYFPEIHKNTTKSLKDMRDALLHVPGVPPPIPAQDAVRPLLDRETEDYTNFLEFCLNIPNSDGVLVNSFDSFETKALEAIRQGKCNPGGDKTKATPIFCVGPLLATEEKGGGGGEVHDCIKWLDLQPSKSVVFLCFGSLGLFSAEQLKEMAVGLERSGHRFLWVVRSPPSEDKSKRFEPLPEPDLDLLLPEGFLDRTKDRGFIVKSWAPQVAVLRHHAIGGFVTHCGWNSVLEAVVAGVPMVAWPLYAEQHHNRWLLVDEFKVALMMREAEDGFVAAEEVEKTVKELMDSESEKGKEVRKVVEERSEEARAAMSEGGSSIAAFDALSKLWIKG